MVTKTQNQPQENFTQALRSLDPILADVYENVQAEQPGDTKWQYMWVGYQQEQGTLNHDREAAKLFEAFALSQPDNPGSTDHPANTVAANITNPYRHAVKDYERNERRWINEMSFPSTHGEPDFTDQDHTNLSNLLESMRNQLASAENLIAQGLQHTDHRTFARGIAILEHINDLV